eukprot:6301084-Prymnesium_polylepis.1
MEPWSTASSERGRAASAATRIGVDDGAGVLGSCTQELNSITSPPQEFTSPRPSPPNSERPVSGGSSPSRPGTGFSEGSRSSKSEMDQIDAAMRQRASAAGLSSRRMVSASEAREKAGRAKSKRKAALQRKEERIRESRTELKA